MEAYEKEQINQFDSGDLLNQQSNPRTEESTYDSFMAPKNSGVDDEEDLEDDDLNEDDDLDDDDDIQDAEVVEEDDDDTMVREDDKNSNRGTMAS
jgi:ribonuclease E